MKIEIDLSEPQQRVFDVLLKMSGGSLGDLLVGLACDRVAICPCHAEGYPDIELQGYCYRYAVAKMVPNAEEWFDEKEMMQAYGRKRFKEPLPEGLLVQHNQAAET